MSTHPGSLSLLVKAESDIGLVRTNNQDSAYVSPTMIALADGMGGAAAGDLASSVAITSLMAVDNQPGTPAHRLHTAISNAHNKLGDLISWNPNLTGLGTTIEAAVFTGNTMSLAHLGDSRVYLLREHELTRLTHDHSLVQELLDSGEITEEEAEYHPRRSLLMRVLNGTYVFKPVLSTHELQLGDRLLFCSDGLSGQLDDDALVALLGSPDTAKTLSSLKQAVFDVGAPDNVTIIVADVVESNAELDAAPPQLFGAVSRVVIPDAPHFGFAEPEGADGSPIGTGIGRGSGAKDIPRAPKGGNKHAQDTSDVQDTQDTQDAQEDADIAWFDVPPDPSTQDSDIGGRRRSRSRKSRRKMSPPTVAANTDTGPDTSGHHKPGLLIGISVIVGVLALIGAGLWSGQKYLSNQYFIGDEQGQVAIFQGLPERIIGIELNWVAETSDTALADLPVFYADQVREGNLRPADLAAARVTLAELEAKAAYCRSLRNPATTPPTPPTPTSSPTTSATTPPATPNTTATPASPTTTSSPTAPPATPGPEDCP
jgi:protein phosphatase